MNKTRLLNVARALRESKTPLLFDMRLVCYSEDYECTVNGDRILPTCGTPACAWGHYISRTDLQDDFRPITDPEVAGPIEFEARSPDGVWEHTSYWSNMSQMQAHFDIDKADAFDLFSAPDDCYNECTCGQCSEEFESDEARKAVLDAGGCGGARTVEEAATFIENWVAEREKHESGEP